MTTAPSRQFGHRPFTDTERSQIDAKVRSLVASGSSRECLWSACGNLLTAGESLNDARVLAEARRLKAAQDRAIERRGRRFA